MRYFKVSINSIQQIYDSNSITALERFKNAETVLTVHRPVFPLWATRPLVQLSLVLCWVCSQSQRNQQSGAALQSLGFMLQLQQEELKLCGILSGRFTVVPSPLVSWSKMLNVFLNPTLGVVILFVCLQGQQRLSPSLFPKRQELGSVISRERVLV